MKKAVENIGVENLKEGSATKQMYEAFTEWEEGLELARSGKGWEAITKLFNAFITDQRACNHKSDISSPSNPNYYASTVLVDNAIENADKEINKAKFSKKNQLDWYMHVYSIIVYTLKAHYMQIVGPFLPAYENADKAVHLTLEAQDKWKKETVPSFPRKISRLLDSGKSILEDRVTLALLALGSQLHVCMVYYEVDHPLRREGHLMKSSEIAQIAIDYEPNYVPGLMQLASNCWRQSDKIKKRRKAVLLFKKISEITPLDDKINAEARFMYALGVCYGYSDLQDITAGKVKELWNWARCAERQSKILFGKTTCEGRFSLKELIKYLKRHKVDDDVIVKMEFKIVEGENRFCAKLSIGGTTAKLAEFTPDELVNTVYRPICCGCNLRFNEVEICSRCKKAWYCSPTCQEAHWPDHKPNCIRHKKHKKET